MATRYLPGVPKGTVRAGYRCENLEEQTFPDEAFDIVITQDVFEHVLDPARAFHEVARTLRPGGVHVFTVPYRYWKPSIVRAVPDPSASGGVRYLLPKDYHEDPIEPEGSLVVTEWGWDLPDLVHRSSGLFTTIIRSRNPQRGIPDPSPEVFLSHKSPTNTSATVLASVAGVNGNLGAGESKNRI